jgi:hypothetical protein
MYKVIVLSCSCGNDRETDADPEVAKSTPCGQCGANKWVLRKSRTVAADPTAPIEMKEPKRRGRKVSDE